MALFHFSAQIIGRSAGRSAVAAAAYRAGVALIDLRTGTRHDYSKKADCQGAEILTPAQAPGWMQEREALWNGVEASERRQDAQLCREINAALPVELTAEQNRNMVRVFVRENFTALGMVVDVAFHHLGSHNPHAHFLLALREIAGEGFGLKNRDWNRPELLREWREKWAELQNQTLARFGHVVRVDHRNLTDQRADLLPHESEKSDALTRLPTIHHGGRSRHKAENMEIHRTNADMAQAIAQARAEHRMQPTPPEQPAQALADLQRESTAARHAAEQQAAAALLEQAKQRVEENAVAIRQQAEQLQRMEQDIAQGIDAQKQQRDAWTRRQARMVRALEQGEAWKRAHPWRSLLGGPFARTLSRWKAEAAAARIARDQAIARHDRQHRRAKEKALSADRVRGQLERLRQQSDDARKACQQALMDVALMVENHRREPLTPEQREAERLLHAQEQERRAAMERERREHHDRKRRAVLRSAPVLPSHANISAPRTLRPRR